MTHTIVSIVAIALALVLALRAMCARRQAPRAMLAMAAVWIVIIVMLAVVLSHVR